MKTTLNTLLAAAMLAGAVAAASPASAATFADIRVMLPNGTYLNLNDTPDRPWYRDRRVTVYDRYYYDAGRRVYVVYDDRHPPRHWKRWESRTRVIERPVARHDNRGNGWHGHR